ncbi:MAG: hypothetical protein LBU64_09115 [Planctomycetota bacterium]|nr:hypothetical protein [Planctomycetota bacterium]
MNPKSLIKNIPSPTEQWKSPVREWIDEMHEKRKGKPARRQAFPELAEAPSNPAVDPDAPLDQG